MPETYSDAVMRHFHHPLNAGEVEAPDGVGEVGNPTCGDMMKITVKIEDGRVADIRWKTLGCGAAIATSSMMTELAKGKTVEEALAITRDQVAGALGGLPPAKLHCSNLAADGLHAALEDYFAKHPEARPADAVAPAPAPHTCESCNACGKAGASGADHA